MAAGKLSEKTISLKLDVHASRFIVPFALSNTSKPAFCSPTFSRIFQGRLRSLDRLRLRRMLRPLRSETLRENGKWAQYHQTRLPLLPKPRCTSPYPPVKERPSRIVPHTAARLCFVIRGVALLSITVRTWSSNVFIPSVWQPRQEMPLRTVGSLAAGLDTIFIGAASKRAPDALTR